ncbi:MAG TPA: T9SS type A sorting domain-containing protein [Chitinophagaceae bacterium]
MQKNFTLTGMISLCLILALSATKLSAQNISASPQNLVRPVGPNTVSVFLDRLSGSWGSSGTYVWSVSPSTGVTIGAYSQSSPAADVTVTFSSAASGAYTFTLTRGSISASVTIHVGNIAASSTSEISAFSVMNGTYISGPDEIFTPTIQTAALGLSSNGYYYMLPNNYTGNDGNVTVYAAKPDGTGQTAIGSIDLNGSSNNDLGFVRLAIDQPGAGWILAGDNTTLYLGKFTTNGINPTTISVVDASVTLVNGNVNTLYNGDLCVSGNGTLYVLGNSAGGGVTQIFVGTPNGANTVLTKKWDLVRENGSSFDVPVNGAAFDALGSLYISSSIGLHYIDQQTVNTATGTVQCALVNLESGLTDLASNLYPLLSTLPVKLLSFSGNYHNQKTMLNWETEGEQNFSHFEIQRSSNGSQFTSIGTKPSVANANSRQTYQFADDLSAVSGTVFTYRLKMVDTDGQFKYSNTILVRKETNNIKVITLNPNPVINGMVTLRFAALTAGNIDIRVIDLSGKTVWQQQNKSAEGNNSISLDGLSRLPAGTYVLQMANNHELQSLKFTITK